MSAMNETDQISHLIGDIYDAALDRSIWPSVLEKTCKYVEGVASALLSHDLRDPDAQFHFSWGDDPGYTKLYNESYVKLNPVVSAAVRQAKVGEVNTYLDFISLDEYRNTRFYKEWAGPQGYVDAVQATLDKSATSFAAAVVMRHESNGPVDDGTRRRMRLLAPHFRRAVAISKVIDRHQVEAATLSDTLDGLAAAMFLVDADARILHANASAHAVLSAGTVLRQCPGRLAFLDAGVEQSLRETFAAVGDRANGARGIAVPLNARDGEQWLVHVLPLTSGMRRVAGDRYAATAAVFLRQATLDLPAPVETIGSLYGLTPAELRVLAAIVDIGGVPEVAPALGISETTVKTHLRHVFDKTGVTRQADLVKLVAGFASPLAPTSNFDGKPAIP
jgi:DNA-binding CsgD family transcriptional regulator